MIIFKTKKGIRRFFKENTQPVIRKKVEFCVFEKYKKKRVLVTAEHAYVRLIHFPQFGENAKIVFGDRNTGWLARISAYNFGSAYIVPRFDRFNADACRNPKLLGKKIEYLAHVIKGNVDSAYVNIHNNINYMKNLLYYHELINDLKPRAILSIHGFSPRKKKKYDILLGFGRKMNLIGGKENALKFKEEFEQKLEDYLNKIDLEKYPSINKDIKVKLSKVFTGHGNYILRKFVTWRNKKIDEAKEPGFPEKRRKRIGLHAEFSSMGRKIGDGDHKHKMLSVEYQVASFLLAKMLYKWSKKIRKLPF